MADLKRKAMTTSSFESTQTAERLVYRIARAWRRIPDRYLAFALFFLALLLRFVYLRDLEAHNPFFDYPIVDSEVYHAWAQRIANGDIVGQDLFFLAPGYAYFLALIYSFFGPSFHAVYLIQALLDSVCVVLLFHLGKAMWNREAGCLAGGLWAIYGPAAFYAGKITAETLAVFLILLSSLLMVQAREQKRPFLLFPAGAITGLAILTRSYWLALIPLWAVTPFLWSHVSPGKRWTALCLFGFGVTLTIAPVTIRNMAVTGQFVLVSGNSGYIFYVGNNPRSTGFHTAVPGVSLNVLEQWRESKRLAEKALGRPLSPTQADGYWRGRALQFIVSDPADFAKLLGRKLMVALSGRERSSLYPFEYERRLTPTLDFFLMNLYLLMPLGMAGVILAGDMRHYWPLHALLAVHLLVMLLFVPDARYRFPAVPIFCLFAAYLGTHLGSHRSRRTLAFIALVLLTGFSSWQWARASLSPAQWPPEIFFNLGNAHLHRGDFEGALHHYGLAHERRPNYPELLNNMGKTFHAMGQRDQARLYWERAHHLKKDFALPLYNLAKLFETMDIALSKEYWSLYLELAQDNPEEQPYVRQGEEFLRSH